MKTVSFIAAASNSGKTTLIEKVVRILKDRGVRIAVVKHASKGFELDREGKDSWRFRRAGAESVVLIGPGQVAVMRRSDGMPEETELSRLAGPVDLLIKEGFKNEPGARIEVFRSGISGARPLAADDPSFLALASDVKFDVGVPCFSIDDADAIADFIRNKFEL